MTTIVSVTFTSRIILACFGAVVLGGSALLGGCDEMTDSAGKHLLRPDTSVVMPLAIGNIWIGRETDYGGQADYDTLHIVSDTMVNGERWFKLRATTPGLNKVPTWPLRIYRNQYLTNRSDGLYGFIFECDGSIDTIARLIAYPMAAGDTIIDYGLVTQVFEDGTRGATSRIAVIVEKSGVMVDLPGGSAPGIHAAIKQWRVHGEHWPYSGPITIGTVDIIPGIGIVRQESHSNYQDGRSTPQAWWELIQSNVVMLE